MTCTVKIEKKRRNNSSVAFMHIDKIPKGIVSENQFPSDIVLLP